MCMDFFPNFPNVECITRVLQEMNRQLLEGTSHINWTRESASPDQAWFYIPENAFV